jgi:hypothetical protein
MTTIGKPKNYFESIMLERQVKMAAEKMAAEAKATGAERGEYGKWSTSMNMWVAPSIAEKHPELVRKDSRDQAGRTISEFEGSPRSWMKDFMQEPRQVTAIKTQ